MTHCGCAPGVSLEGLSLMERFPHRPGMKPADCEQLDSHSCGSIINCWDPCLARSGMCTCFALCRECSGTCTSLCSVSCVQCGGHILSPHLEKSWLQNGFLLTDVLSLIKNGGRVRKLLLSFSESPGEGCVSLRECTWRRSWEVIIWLIREHLGVMQPE